MPTFPQVRGRHGSVTVKGLGAVVGRFDGKGGWWELNRVKEKQKTGEKILYRFSAVLSYVNPTIWSAKKADGSERYEKEILIKVGGDTFRIDVADGQRMELHGRVLRSEGVTLWQVK